MKNSQLKEGKRLKREIKIEKQHLERMQFDFEYMGGRHGSYFGLKPSMFPDGHLPSTGAEKDLFYDMEQLKRCKERITKLEKLFAEL